MNKEQYLKDYIVMTEKMIKRWTDFQYSKADDCEINTTLVDQLIPEKYLGYPYQRA